MPLELVILIGKLLLKFGPDVAQKLMAIYHKSDPPSQAEWDALFASARETWKDRIV